MPPKKPHSAAPRPNTVKQKKFKPPLLAHPPPAPLSDAGTSDSQGLLQSQQGDDEMVTLGQILESMMKVSKDRRTRRRKEIEEAYRDELVVAEGRARKWVHGVRVQEKHRQLMALTKLRILLGRKQALENDILAALEVLEGACEGFGGMLKTCTDSHEGRSEKKQTWR